MRSTTMRHHLLIAPLMALLLVPGIGATAERDSPFDERPSVGEPLRFRADNGGAFRPRALLIQTGAGTVRAILPEASDDARSEDRVDLSSTPLVGPLFRGTLSTDNARQGQRIGALYHAPGDYLLVVVDGAAQNLTGYPVALTTNLPSTGAVSYRLGRLSYGASGAPVNRGTRVGEAWLVGGQLVLASRGGEPAYPSIEALINDIFQ